MDAKKLTAIPYERVDLDTVKKLFHEYNNHAFRPLVVTGICTHRSWNYGPNVPQGSRMSSSTFTGMLKQDESSCLSRKQINLCLYGRLTIAACSCCKKLVAILVVFYVW